MKCANTQTSKLDGVHCQTKNKYLHNIQNNKITVNTSLLIFSRTYNYCILYTILYSGYL